MTHNKFVVIKQFDSVVNLLKIEWFTGDSSVVPAECFYTAYTTEINYVS